MLLCGSIPNNSHYMTPTQTNAPLFRENPSNLPYICINFWIPPKKDPNWVVYFMTIYYDDGKLSSTLHTPLKRNLTAPENPSTAYTDIRATNHPTIHPHLDASMSGPFPLRLRWRLALFCQVPFVGPSFHEMAFTSGPGGGKEDERKRRL